MLYVMHVSDYIRPFVLYFYRSSTSNVKLLPDTILGIVTISCREVVGPRPLYFFGSPPNWPKVFYDFHNPIKTGVIWENEFKFWKKIRWECNFEMKYFLWVSREIAIKNYAFFLLNICNVILFSNRLQNYIYQTPSYRSPDGRTDETPPRFHKMPLRLVLIRLYTSIGKYTRCYNCIWHVLSTHR